MRIGIDATCWGNGRGYGRFTRELVSAMVASHSPHEFVCFLDTKTAPDFALSADKLRMVVTDLRESPAIAASANGHRSPWDVLKLSRAIRAEALDVFFVPSVYSYVPLPRNLPSVVTIHDAIPERFPHLTLPTVRSRVLWSAKVRMALWQARLVLTVSDFAAEEIASVHGVAKDRIRVALEAPAAGYKPSESAEDIAEAARMIGLPAGARWLMYVGGFSPHKNLDVLVRAHRAAVRQLKDPLYLVLVGSVTGDVFHSCVAAIRSAIDACGSTNLVLWPGRLTDEQIRHLHSGAVALVLPSANEGFGLPAVEAAACAAPIIGTTASPLPQLLEGGGVFVPPGDEGALARAIVQLAEDEEMRVRLGRRARERAAMLSWTQGARVALQALEEAAA
jgi:glycosyltransferase involved in cell wall biosynthesis